MTQDRRAFQDQMPSNHCWGCGPSNKDGLQIKSYWAEDGEEGICTWQPAPYHLAGPKHILNGGIISTLIDCHSICTAIAAAYKAEGRDIGDDIWYVTGSLQVRYLLPTPVDQPVTLRARITETTEKKSIVACSLYSNGQETARAEVVAIKVNAEAWRGHH